jgi:hypothetical protein
MVDYWAREERAPTAKEKLDGLAFSFLGIIDGVSGNFSAALDLVVEGGGDYPAGEVLNAGVMLHELWHRVPESALAQPGDFDEPKETDDADR